MLNRQRFARAITRTFRTLYERIWAHATDEEERLNDLASGESSTKTMIISDAQKTNDLLQNLMRNAEEEIIGIGDFWDMVNGLKNYPVVELFKRGVKMRAMVSLNESNLDKIRGIARFVEIRNIDDAYARIIMVDRSHLTQFRQPTGDRKDGISRFQNMIYTNDPAYVGGMHRMLTNLWGRSTTIGDFEKDLRPPNE